MDREARKIVTETRKVANDASAAYDALFASMFGRGHTRRGKRSVRVTFEVKEVERTLTNCLSARADEYSTLAKDVLTLIRHLRKLSKKEKTKRFGSVESYRTTERAGEVYAELLDRMSKDLLVMVMFAKVVFGLAKATPSLGKAELSGQPKNQRRPHLLSNKLVAPTALRLFLAKQAAESGKSLSYVR